MEASREPAPLSQRIERARRVVSHCSQAAIRSYDEEALLTEACRTLIDQGDYCMAWFAETKLGEARLTTLAHAAASSEGVREGELPWTAELGPRMPTMRALVEQRPYVARDILDDPVLRQRHPRADSQGYSSISAFPMQFGPHGAGVLTVYDRAADAFSPEEVALLRELAGDMAVAVSGLRARKANDLLEERLEAAERRYRSIVEDAPVGVVQVGRDGRILIANHALAMLLGYPSAEEVAALGPDDLPRHVEAANVERLRGVLRLGAPFPPVELQLRRVDGQLTWVEVRVKPTNGGSEGAFEAFVRDISVERSAATAREAQARQRLEVARLKELDRMRAEFIGRASHELNTPLTPILLQVQAMQLLGLDERQARSMALIERNVMRITGLVKDLLLASTIEAGRLKLKPILLDLSAKAAEVVETFREQAFRAGVDLRIEPAGPAPAYADEGCVTQVLFNLVSNALKFTPRGGSVLLRCGTRDGMALCTVADTGHGFPPEQEEKLYEPFGRLHEHMPRDPGGTGLGLFISRAVLDQSGGTLSAHSPGPGKGSTFSFTLPVQAPGAGSRPGRGIVVAKGFEAKGDAAGPGGHAAAEPDPAAVATKSTPALAPRKRQDAARSRA